MRRKLTGLVLATVIILSCLAFITVVTSNDESSATVSAKVTGARAKIGIYTNSVCTQKLTTISWGAIDQGSSANRTVYIKNLSTTTLNLKLSTTNWNPTTANGPITITWNQENTVLKPYQVISATLKVDVASNTTDITTFGMSITIIGTSA